MDLQSQERVKQTAEHANEKEVIVVLGALDIGAVELWGQTVTTGDPTYVGPLAGVQLGLPVYHILEPEVKAQIPADVYEAQVGIMEMVLDIPALSKAMKKIREQTGQIGS